MPILQGTKRNMEKEREKRKTRIRSFCVENQSPILLSKTTFCLTSLLLPPDCRNRQNISKLFNLKKRVGKQMMMSTQGAQQPFFYLLPVYLLLCLLLSAGESWETPTAQLPGRSRAQWQLSAAGLLLPNP